MISELMRCSLLDVLRTANIADNKPAISRRRSIRYAVQLSQGMNYLHTCARSSANALPVSRRRSILAAYPSRVERAPQSQCLCVFHAPS
eukprot:scaffold11044_cov30-Tisochrysis_lutea.AAC.3